MPELGEIVQLKISKDEVRPAIIVRAWSEECVNLLVFPDGSNDGAEVNYNPSFNVGLPGNKGSIGGGYVAGVWMTSVMKGDNIGQWNSLPEK